MLFTENRYDRSIESMMKGIPNFYPRGSGIVVTGKGIPNFHPRGSGIVVTGKDIKKNSIKNSIYRAYKDVETIKVEAPKSLSNGYDKLQSMVGLTEIKSIINQIISAQKMNKARRDMGLDTVCSSKHMIFTGNPGSAKTTVARLLASILYDEHVLNKNKFIECGRQDLVGKYVGWTAKQVEVQFQKAKGGSCLLTKRILLLKKKAYTVTRRSTRSFR